DRRFLDQLEGVIDRISLGAIHLGTHGLHALRQLGQFLFGGHDHFTPSITMPMLRALPAMVRTAASRSPAVKSGVFSLAISSACPRVSLPTLSVCGLLLPFSTFAAFRMSTVAGGVFITKVKLLSA